MFNGKTVFAGSLSYVVRLTFQSFDQFHSDSQAPFQLFRLALFFHEIFDEIFPRQ